MKLVITCLIAMAIAFMLPGSGQAREILVTHPAWQALANELTGPGDTVTLLGRSGDPHQLTLSPRQAHALAKADMVIITDRLMEGDIMRKAGGRVVVVNELAGTPPRGMHSWLDLAYLQRAIPILARKMGEKVKGAALAGKLKRLQKSISDKPLQPSRMEIAYLTLHPAYEALEVLLGIPKSSRIALQVSHGGATPRQLQAIEEQLRGKRLNCVLLENDAPRALAARLAEQHQARLMPLDLVAVSSPDFRGYAALLTRVANTLRACSG